MRRQKTMKKELKLAESLRSSYVRRAVAIEATETSTEKKVCNWINSFLGSISWSGEERDRLREERDRLREEQDRFLKLTLDQEQKFQLQ
ncbi:hypothetical protein L6452_19995 [Arctium lappa]|uniref:Uncharacterized protein n=1 Tax=Arctium lappa TaxID=4217 RepID=A0ACB9B9P1_ARCLA|nr:hypothetical protein L6452_19995 [Arctium lappa]